MLQTLGLGYAAIIVRDLQASLEFYRRLGLTLLYVEPNRDDAQSVTAMLAAGDGETFLQLVGPVDASVPVPDGSAGVGSLQYLSLRVSAEQMAQMFHELSNAGVQGSELIERGFERLVFVEDPNGVLIILTAWATEPPPGMARATVLRRAAALRARDGAQYVEDAHVREAIAALRAELPAGR